MTTEPSVEPTPLPFDRVVAAHRGAQRLAPENTLSAFRAAMDHGAVALELDVHSTSDGQVVVIHDSRVDRTTDGEGAVRSLTAAQLGSLDAGAGHPADFAGERVPSLQQVLELTEGRSRINVELKSTQPDVESIIEIICRHDAVERVLLMSFDLNSVLAAKRVATSARWRTRAAGLPVLPIVVESLADPLGLVRSTGLDGLNYPPQHWDAHLIGRFRAEGLTVHGGLINDRSALDGFFRAGGQLADSDDPELFRHDPERSAASVAPDRAR